MTTPIPLLAFILLATGCGTIAQQGVTVTETNGGYVFAEGSDTVMVYHAQPPDPDREHARAHYVHPLYSLDGVVLTEDFPEDHLHQHGLYWAWHQVFVGDRRVGDGWIQEDVDWRVRSVDVLDEAPTAGLRARVEWTSPHFANGDEPFVEEVATLRAHPEAAGYRAIDVEIALRALVGGVRIGGSEDDKGYGGLSLRVRLPDDVAFVGPEGPVEPMVTAVEAGPWVDVSATYDGRPSGVAMLQHPSLPDYPQTWILRAADSMQNPKWPGAEPVLIPTDRPVTLRYRLVVHEGRAGAVDLDGLQAAYGS